MHVYVRGGPEIMVSPGLAVPDHSSFGGSGPGLPVALSNSCFVATCPPATRTRPEELMLQVHSQRGVACKTNVLHVWIQFHGALRAQCAHYNL